MARLLDAVPLWLALLPAVTVGLSPFLPEPHLWEKLRMLSAGELRRGIDIFDLALHGAPWLLLLAKLGRMALRRR
ncbi:RND transporter [Rhodovulum sp.]|uniref:RND transporter n=1 Tax=Rhodovulum sp. TaxID=34009 RepID=UPI001811D9ED|nr:RND transporter [Rhodovulum sp.]HDR29956.1 RND transporter [Rhodovulum sp.]